MSRTSTDRADAGPTRRLVPLQPGAPAATGPEDGARAGMDAPTEVLPTVGPGSAPTAAGTPRGIDSPPAAAAPRPTAGPADDPDPDDLTPQRRNGMGTPALVLGLLAAGTCWTGWAGVVLGLPAVVAGYLGARRAFNNLATDGGSSLGGFVLGLVGLVVGAVVVWPTLFGTGAFGDGLTLDQCLTQATSAKEMHMCKSQHLAEFNQRFPNAAE